MHAVDATKVSAAGEAFDLAKAAGSKLTNSILEAGSKLIPTKDAEPPRQEWRQGRDYDPFDIEHRLRRRGSPYGVAARPDTLNDLFGSVFKNLGMITVSACCLSAHTIHTSNDSYHIFNCSA